MGICFSRRPSAASAPGQEEVLFFPDPAMPCYRALYGKPCRRANCKYTHELTSLVRLLLEIRKARRTLVVCVFTITCTEIADEIVAAAKERGVKVRVITDDVKMDDQGSKAFDLKAKGIRVRHDHNSLSHMHHKFAVVDNKTLLNGSFNWTRGAVLNNRENVVISHNPALVRAFCGEFNKLWALYGG
ncbi:putative phospholipase [Chloropicon primus]|uniref:Mitochondrial cardiolipin hydrolase n=2 Tax=Chloropicon primus TaxID=1764295 RepID=A0A5B8MS08_9CHLO|nr:putative phospholipase [Chloropicon primus]UPR02591.1 putative phospholipase [Chloropicon primus]|eukprot:QDZ23379.1 putative phospholipase [Chloropicon primus]